MIAPTQINNGPDQQLTSMTLESLAQAPVPVIDVERKHKMHEALKAYEGDFPKPLKISPNQPDDNAIVNKMRTIVEKGVSFLFGPELGIEATDETTSTSSSAPSPAQDFVEGLWGDTDQKMTLLSKVATNGGLFGQTFVKLIPAQSTMKYPRLVNLNPCNIRIVTDPEDCDLHIAYIIEYPSANDWQKKQIIARVDPDGLADITGQYDLDDRWTIANYVRKGQDSAWIQAGSPVEWPYPFAPIFTCQNTPRPNDSWGDPDLTENLIHQNKVLNFLLSNLIRIAKFHAHPVTYATGLSATQIQLAIDDLICLPSPESKIEKLAAMENFSGMLQIIANIMSNIDESSHTPGVALGRLTDLPKGTISGVALQLLFQPLIERTTQKRRLYGSMIRDITRAAMVIAGVIPLEQYEDYAIDLRWANLLPIDDLAAAQTAQLLQAIGVSQSTLMQELGYDPDSESDKTDQENARKMTAFSRGQGLPPAQQATQMIQQDTQMAHKSGEGDA